MDTAQGAGVTYGPVSEKVESAGSKTRAFGPIPAIRTLPLFRSVAVCTACWVERLTSSNAVKVPTVGL
jgi:hypothetical protein